MLAGSLVLRESDVDSEREDAHNHRCNDGEDVRQVLDNIVRVDERGRWFCIGCHCRVNLVLERPCDDAAYDERSDEDECNAQKREYNAANVSCRELRAAINCVPRGCIFKDDERLTEEQVV